MKAVEVIPDSAIRAADGDVAETPCHALAGNRSDDPCYAIARTEKSAETIVGPRDDNRSRTWRRETACRKHQVTALDDRRERVIANSHERRPEHPRRSSGERRDHEQADRAAATARPVAAAQRTPPVTAPNRSAESASR